jgi:phage gpG-like protein
MAFKKINKFQLDKALTQFKKEKNKLPKILGNMAKRHFRQNFINEGFTDTVNEKWKEVQRRIPGTRAYKYPKKKGLSRRRRGILRGKGSGVLMRSVDVQRASFDAIVVGTKGVEYAAIHNDGLMGNAFGKYKFKMPKRQFIGNSKQLERAIEKRIVKELDKVFKNG